MIDFYNPNIPVAATEYCILLPFMSFIACIISVVLQAVGFDIPPYYISDVTPAMYEMLPIAFNGVRK